jgi:sigma-B regulation protein RsbU (phosphoserine phosphatase)
MNKELEFTKLKRNLGALVEFSKIINSSLDINFILNNLLYTCLGKFQSTKSFVALVENNELVLRSSKGFSDELAASFPKDLNIDSEQDFSAFSRFVASLEMPVTERISSSGKTIGIICLGKRLSKAEFAQDDLDFLHTILNIVSTAIENSMAIDELKRVNRNLDTRINRLNSLFELSKEFGLLDEESRVSKLLTYSIIGQFLVSNYAVVYCDKGKLKILESKIEKNELYNALSCIDIQKIDEAVQQEEIEKSFPSLAEMNIVIAVPMQIQGKTKGLILLGRRINNVEYNSSDVEFIFSIGSLAIISLENKRLFKEAIEKQKLEEELEIARDIQRNLLPGSFPELNSFEITGMNISSKQVGGDYYDIIKLDSNNYCIAIGDVSGKGVPAALLMANLQAFLKTTCKHGMKLDEATALINDLITENTTDGRFITFFWGILSENDKKFDYVNAGHNPPLLIRQKVIKKLKNGGLLLGVMKTFIPYENDNIQLEKDDIIILFTDGVSEAKDRFDNEFSDERLEALSIANSQKSAGELLKIITDDVQRFAAGTHQSDDITLLIIKVK